MVTDTVTGNRPRRPTRSPLAGEVATLAVVSGAHLVSHLHMLVLPSLLHLLRERAHVGYFELGLAITVFSVVTGLTQAPMGVLVDRIGARVVLVAGLVLGGAAFASLALTGAYAWLMAAAVIAGLANCVYHPADYAILNDSIAERRIGRAFGVHTFAGFAGGAIAPPMLLGIAGWAGLEAAFIAAGAVAWVMAAMAMLMPASPGERRARAAAAPDTVGLRQVLTPTVLGLTLFFTLLGLSGSSIWTFGIAALIGGYDVSAAIATAAVTAFMSGAALGVLAGGPLADRTSRHGDVAAVGFAVAALLTLAVAVVPMAGSTVVVALGLTGLIYGIVQPARDMLVRKAAPPGAAGRVFGIVSTGFNIGGILGPVLLGFLMDQGAPRWVFGATAAFMAITAALGLFEERRSRLAADAGRT